MIYAIFLCYTASSCAELFQPGNWYVTCIIAKVELEHLATKKIFFLQSVLWQINVARVTKLKAVICIVCYDSHWGRLFICKY